MKKKFLAIVLVIVLLGAGYGIYAYLDSKNYVTTDDAKVTADIYSIGGKTGGKVKEVKVQEGDEVKAGELLVKFEDDLAKAQLEQAQAGLSAAQMQLKKVLKGARVEDVNAARALYEQALAGYNGAKESYEQLSKDIDDLQKKYDALKPLLANPATPQEVKDQANELLKQIAQLKYQQLAAKTQMNTAQAGVKAAKSKLDLALNGAQLEDVKAVEAQVKAQEAALKLAKLNLDATEVKAPVKGEVVKVWVKPGEILAPGQAAVSLADFSNLYVTANILEKEISGVKVGALVKIYVDALGGKVLSGKVESIGRATQSTFNLFSADSFTGSFTKVSQRIPIKIKLLEKPEGLIPGLSVTVKIKK
ncbi:HlyD family secretion protein [Carboxydothermus ferrireducens]|uniref:Multidrug resistance efflux pump n=1 Tax=Carboxydothermus ferrireducens DSM 11255 TaxID=1119529 RepID=A0ABX2RCE1_9THEO|nr:HlyD family secretion protein [Carboxydothermus ferrireducens]NYE58595.1 multidrug resistance efflux pump [Carboxydothermus ferrireducens DSM 11255]